MFIKLCAGLREGQALQSLSLVDDSLTAAHAVMVAQELSGLPLELLLLGPSDDHLTMVGAESLAAFWDAPLSFSVRHRFKSSALALIEERNSEANKRGDEEDEAEATGASSRRPASAANEWQISILSTPRSTLSSMKASSAVRNANVGS